MTMPPISRAAQLTETAQPRCQLVITGPSMNESRNGRSIFSAVFTRDLLDEMQLCCLGPMGLIVEFSLELVIQQIHAGVSIADSLPVREGPSEVVKHLRLRPSLVSMVSSKLGVRPEEVSAIGIEVLMAHLGSVKDFPRIRLQNSAMRSSDLDHHMVFLEKMASLGH